MFHAHEKVRLALVSDKTRLLQHLDVECTLRLDRLIPFTVRTKPVTRLHYLVTSTAFRIFVPEHCSPSMKLMGGDFLQSFACGRRNVLRYSERRFSASQLLLKRPKSKRTIARVRRRFIRTGASLALLGVVGWTASETSDSLRHLAYAMRRCSTIADAVIRDVIDYKQTLGASYTTEEERLEAQSRCHKRSAERILEALQNNGGMYLTRSLILHMLK